MIISDFKSLITAAGGGTPSTLPATLPSWIGSLPGIFAPPVVNTGPVPPPRGDPDSTIISGVPDLAIYGGLALVIGVAGYMIYRKKKG
jgi:hypothetical protein